VVRAVFARKLHVNERTLEKWEQGRVYDPCCGSGGMFVSSEKFIEAHSSKIGDISIYGQESNYTTWRLAKMNLAIRGIDAQIAHGDTFHNDKHPDLRTSREPASRKDYNLNPLVAIIAHA